MNLEMELLTAEHNTKDFDCDTNEFEEDKDLNDFIKKDALPQKEGGWNKTYVLVEKGKKDIFGFFAVAPDKFKVEEEAKREGKKPYWTIPAFKIGRLAVDKNYRGKGMGPFLVRYAMGLIIKEICPKVGGMYITLDSYPHRVDWYKKHFNFRENTLIKQDGSEYVNLIFPIKDFNLEK